MMLGFLLARAGVPTLVLEKHADFLRDFRGDTIHPSTLELFHELGLIDAFLARPHQKAQRLSGFVGGVPITIADFSHVPTHCKFIALMPQWDFLDFLTDHGRLYPTFDLRTRAEAVDLIADGERIVGLRARTPEGEREIRADLVVAADGRRSLLRERAGLAVDDLGAPMDVLWMRLSRRPEDGSQPLGHITAGRLFVMIDRGDYWQCALVIRKGGYEIIRQQGLEAFRAAIVKIVPALRDRVAELQSWDDIKLLTVTVDRLRRWWRPSFLCIGDAAHAMSPIGGVGINLAIQDAVAAANILATPLRDKALTDDHLAAVERRRTFPTRVTQWLQIRAQNTIIRRVLASEQPISPPWPVRLLSNCPMLQRIPARLIGVGIRPEHIRTPELAPKAALNSGD